MAWTPNDSPINVTPDMQKALETANAEQIKELMKQAAVDQRLVVREWDTSILTPVTQGTAPQKVGKVVVLNGVKHTLEAATEQELLAKENALYRSQLQPATTTTTRQTVEQPPVNQANADQKAALSLEFQMGRLTVDEYLQQSGAIDSYLADQGIDMDSLREVAASQQTERTIQSWAEATEEFKNSSAGASWPGGEANRAKLGEILIEMGAEDSPNAENLRLAYQYMQENNLLVPNSEIEVRDRIAEATSPAELREALGYNERSSGMFGR